MWLTSAWCSSAGPSALATLFCSAYSPSLVPSHAHSDVRPCSGQKTASASLHVFFFLHEEHQEDRIIMCLIFMVQSHLLFSNRVIIRRLFITYISISIASLRTECPESKQPNYCEDSRHINHLTFFLEGVLTYAWNGGRIASSRSLATTGLILIIISFLCSIWK